MKLEVGQFVRIKDGIIDKVIIDYNGHCANPNCEYKHISCAKNYYDEDKIVKASYNIIDILEVGDYVNGMEVTRISGTRYDKNDLHCYCEHNGNENWQQVMIPVKNIKSIVTKEQFEEMSYKIKE
jgi:hypothetical protein|nr:MAG TPA: hypothetical protein [Caudoviricetes sp.]